MSLAAMPLVDANEILKYDLSNENDELIVYMHNECSFVCRL